MTPYTSDLGFWFLRFSSSLFTAWDAPDWGKIMGFDYIVGCAVAAALLVYLLYVLTHPEKF